MFHVKQLGGNILEEIIKSFMHTLKDIMATKQLNAQELDAMDFAIELVTEAWVEELHNTQAHIDQMKKTGMMN